jgi:hypothetical protein
MVSCPACGTAVGAATQCPRCGHLLRAQEGAAEEISFELERRAPMSQGHTPTAPGRELTLEDQGPSSFGVVEVAARRAPMAAAPVHQTPISQFPPADLGRHGPRPIVQPEEARAVSGVPEPPTRPRSSSKTRSSRSRSARANRRARCSRTADRSSA